MSTRITRWSLAPVVLAFGVTVWVTQPVVGARQAAPATRQPAAPAVPQETLPSGADIIRRHVAAIGGQAAFAALKSMRAVGRLELVSQKIVGDLEILSARPSKLLYRVTVPGIGRIENGFDGTVAWSLSPISGPEILTGRQRSEAADDALFDAALHASPHVREVTTLARAEFDGRPAFKVKVVFGSGNEQTEYFDVTTGLQMGSEAARATPQGIVPTVNILRDYRRFGPLLQASVFVQRALGFEQVVTLTSFEYDVVPDAAFELPAQVKALVQK